MCRLITFQNIEPLKAKLYFDWFRLLAENGNVPQGYAPGHEDGWGIGGYKNGKMDYFKKEANSALQGQEYDKIVSNIVSGQSDLIVGHLRKSSVGNVSFNNTHPFIFEDFVFCHNGTIFKSENIKLDSYYESLIQGTTDSERFFMLIMQYMASRKDEKVTPSLIRESLMAAVKFLRENFDYAALNFIFTNGKYTWALREINEDNNIVKEKKMLDYYSLYQGIGKDGKSVIVSSEKIEDQDISWRLIENHEILEINTEKGIIDNLIF